MKLSDFDYDLPDELIAQYPLKDRESARLLVVNRKYGTLEHRIFSEISGYFKKGDLLVLNDTKVLPCRLFGKRETGGKVEVFLLAAHDNSRFSAMISPGRVKPGESIIFNKGGLKGTVLSKNEIVFSGIDKCDIYSHGVMPLPPYIRRPAEEIDNTYYQTVYARQEGAVASPTAGLHFTRALLNKISSSGVKLSYITLHVGPGTFRPVKCIDIESHKMEKEYYSVPESTCGLLDETRLYGGRVFAVGTTACRALEASFADSKSGFTELFIRPGYEFKAFDCLLTNFHLPRTTLFMLVCAFAGERLMKEAYRQAIENKYRFYSYGDAMLII